MPDPELATADFSALFDSSAVSHSVYPMRGVKALYGESMARVLLSPNLVFESSRSSVEAPRTAGPAGARAAEPDLQDALGRPIKVALSSLLLHYLAGKGSVLITPAISRKWLASPLCAANSPTCAQSTWVERLLLARSDDPDANPIPTVAFAVREVGMANLDVPVVAKRGRDRTISFHPRRSRNEDSICGDVTLSVPTVIFSAEIVSMRDGRLIARIDERRFPTVEIPHASIDLVKFKPVERSAYAQAQWGKPIVESEYTYVKEWTQKTIYCKESLRAYKNILRDAEKAMARDLPETVAKILTESLDELY